MRTLKCPWCGCSPIVERWGRSSWQVACVYVACDVQPAVHYKATRAEAIEAWNRREAK